MLDLCKNENAPETMVYKKVSVSRVLSFAENAAKHSQTRCKQLFAIFQLNLGQRYDLQFLYD